MSGIVDCYQFIIPTNDISMVYVVPISCFEKDKSTNAIFVLLSEGCGKSWSEINDVCYPFLQSNTVANLDDDFITISKNIFIKAIYLYVR